MSSIEIISSIFTVIIVGFGTLLLHCLISSLSFGDKSSRSDKKSVLNVNGRTKSVLGYVIAGDDVFPMMPTLEMLVLEARKRRFDPEATVVEVIYDNDHKEVVPKGRYLEAYKMNEIEERALYEKALSALIEDKPVLSQPSPAFSSRGLVSGIAMCYTGEYPICSGYPTRLGGYTNPFVSIDCIDYEKLSERQKQVISMEIARKPRVWMNVAWLEVSLAARNKYPTNHNLQSAEAVY